MKKLSLATATFILLSVYSETTFGQDQTVNGNLNVTQGTQLTGNTQVGTTSQFSQFIVYGNSFVGSAAHPTQFNVNGGVFFHNDLNVDGTATFGALGTTNVNGNMMLHKDVFVDGTTWLGTTNIGNAGAARSLTVYGPSSFGTSASPQQLIVNGNTFLNNQLTVTGTSFLGGTQIHDLTVNTFTNLNGATQIGSEASPQTLHVNGPAYVGTAAVNQILNVDGNTLLHQNLTVDKGTTLTGNTQIGNTSTAAQLIVYGNTFVGSAATPQVLTVTGNTFLEGVTHIGGTASINASLINNYKLWVEKGVVSEDFAIAPTSAWADYVFGDGYKLQPLKEVETYLKANKHLRDIPAQSEVEEKGYSMKKINAGLLKKVEELTLYAIDQDKKIDQLTAEMAKMKEAIDKLKK